MRHLLTIFVLIWGILRVLWMAFQRQPGNGGPAPKPQPGARKIFSTQEILQELQIKKINLSPELETKIRTAVVQQQFKKFELANQSYALLKKAQLKPNQPAVNLLTQSKKLNHNFALLQDTLKAQGK